MAKVKRNVWILAFKSALEAAKRLLKHPDQLRDLIKEALIKMRKHSAAIRDISTDLHVLLRLLKAWLAGEYKDISLKSLAILIAAILYFLNPFDAVPDAIPVVGYFDDVSVVGWVLKILKDEIVKFRVWETS